MPVQRAADNWSRRLGGELLKHAAVRMGVTLAVEASGGLCRTGNQLWRYDPVSHDAAGKRQTYQCSRIKRCGAASQAAAKGKDFTKIGSRAGDHESDGDPWARAFC